MAEYPKNILQSFLDTKQALLAALELIQDLEKIGPLENQDYASLQPLLVKIGKYSKPEGEISMIEQEYGYKLYAWSFNAKEAKIIGENPAAYQ